MGCDHVESAGITDFRLFVFSRNQKIGSQRHNFPGKQKTDTVTSQHDSAHTGGHHTEKEGHFSDGGMVVISMPVGACVECGTAGNTKNGE